MTLAGCAAKQYEMEQPTIRIINLAPKKVSEITYSTCDDSDNVKPFADSIKTGEAVIVDMYAECINLFALDNNGHVWLQQNRVSTPPSFVWTIR
tara:strand:+ start:771 stop:1052 length:282 start_codon:yes stop_codon:yes gene_type:complete